MDEQKKEMSAQVQPETAETLQTDEINEQTVQIEQAEVEMAAESAAEAERNAQQEETEPQAEAPEQKAEPEQTELSQAQAELQAVADQTASVQEELPEEPERVTVVDVRFRNNAKTYFFDPGELRPGLGAHVIIETARGDEFGICAGMRHEVKASEIVPPLRKVLRLATAQDERINRDNQEKEKRAFEVCQQKIADHKLDMQLVSAEVAFDGSKILFFFTAEGRVDFRELVKDLASSFRTRIELRQIGVRDKAKMVGGLGVCGRPFCCKEFLDDFQPVSIKMAKTQNLSLNPTKISGTCGRLMCCLKYEQEAYEDLLKTAPKNESFVDTPDGRGTVTEVNLLKQCVRVRLEQQPDTIVCHHNCDICVLRNGKARKTDPPIPDDLAPISGNPQKCRKKEAPELKTYLEPVVMRQNAAVLEEARTNEADIQNEQQRGRRRRRGGRGRRHEGEGEVPQEQEARRPAEAKKPAEPKKPAESKKPAEARKLAEARPEQAEGEPKKQRPRRQRPPRAPKPEGEKPPRAEAAPVDAPHGGEKPKPRRRPRGHRKPGGPKPEGGGEV